jgi:GGDEF domain-containing protein
MSPDAFLGRALLDPTTGLPNVPYFKLIREWEERRAQRRSYSVREVTMRVSGGAVSVRRALSWRLCRELRESDLIASGGPGEFHILLTTPDAEYADRVCGRIERMALDINELHPDEPPLEVQMEVTPLTEADAVRDRVYQAATAPAPGPPPEPLTTDREVDLRPAVEPTGFRERRRVPRAAADAPIVPRRNCAAADGTNAA